MNILIIGAGQLGSRHLQSCLKLTEKSNIYVVDNNIKSIDLCRVRESEIENRYKHKVFYCNSSNDIKIKEFRIMICATGASPRYQLLSECLSMFNIKYAIIEKILFQSLEDYNNANVLLENSDTIAYVNCPLRTYPFYQKLKNDYFKEKSKIEMIYRGGDWIGLACNSIHYIDLLSYLTNESLLRINTKLLDDDIIESKRIGYIEFTGTISCEFSLASKLSVNSIKNSSENSSVEINNGIYKICINELSGEYEIYENESLLESSVFEVIYQSDLTHLMIEQLNKYGTCDLICYKDSSRMQEIFVNELLSHYNKHNEKNSLVLPIT